MLKSDAQLTDARVALYFQAVLVDGLFDLPARELARLRNMAAADLVCLLEWLVARDAIGVQIDGAAVLPPDGLDATAPDLADRLFLALGREAGMAGVLAQLIKMGALGRPVVASLRDIVQASNGLLTRSNVHFNLRRLREAGLVEGAGQKHVVSVTALRDLLAQR